MTSRPPSLILLLVASGVFQLRAESSATEPEIRRALPVADSSSSPNPIPIMRALPVSDATPVVVTAMPTPSPTPVTPDPSSNSEGTIRFAPTGIQDSAEALAAQLQIAEGFYGRKQPESAVPEYEKFLMMSSKISPGRERALYHLAESQRLMGSAMAAESTYHRLLRETPSTQYKAAAEFRLGEISESSGHLLAAADAFAQAAASASDPSIIQAAHFREALCRDKSGEKEKAIVLFESVAQENEKNKESSIYRLQSEFRLATAATEAEKKEKALDWYSKILTEKPPGETLAEAEVKSALIQSELGKGEEAQKILEQVIASKEAGQWRSVAALAILRLASESGDEAKVLKVASVALAGNDDNKPEVLLLQANAFRKLGKNSQALTLYDTIMREYPASNAAALAPFQRLLTLYATHADSLLTEIDQYLLTASNPADRARAQLLRAEETLHRGKYQEAANLYHHLDTNSLPSYSKQDIEYKEAWALTQAGNTDAAITALTTFINAYPQDERASTALAQRAILKQKKKNLIGALADFTQIDQQYPKATERELALQQKALLLGQQQQNKAMVDTFTILLRDFPITKAAPQAHYWIGWTAMENKDYTTAVKELSEARKGDPKEFGERAGIRILLADYYLDHPEEAAHEATALPPSLIPEEVGRWLGVKSLASGNPARAEKFLTPLVASGLSGASDIEIQGMLASALIAQEKYKEAQTPASVSLQLARDPAARANALLVMAFIQKAMKNFSQASSMIDEAILLQPEGPINAQARILNGDMMLSRQDYTSAAKAYMTVAILSDDPIQAPKALTKAITAYQLAGNNAETEKAIAELKKRFPNTPVPAKSKDLTN